MADVPGGSVASKPLRGSRRLTNSQVGDLRGRGRGPVVVDARDIVAESHEQQNGQPEDAREDHQLGTPGTVLRVHEEQHDQRGLDSGNDERHDNIESAEIDVGGGNRKARQSQQRGDDGQVRSRLDDMFGMSLFRHARHSLFVPVNQV